MSNNNTQNTITRRLEESLNFIREKTDRSPDTAVILGSGLGGYADNLNNKTKIATAEIPYFPASTVSGHQGNLVFGDAGSKAVLALQGRTHYYEGHSIQDVAYVIRIMKKLGIKNLLVTNAAGGLNAKFTPGDLMIIVDHINLMFRNPLTGLPASPEEPRWPDMYNAYDSALIEMIGKTGLQLGIPLQRGVLLASTGPTYETAAEVRMARQMGADAVSMSTVPEVLMARTLNIRVAGISCITNMATGIGANPLSHAEVTEIAAKVRTKFIRVVDSVLQKMAKSADN
ncbi:MAG: purine-nucleoside phosphorylase [Calditrichia bacterium]